MWETQVQSLGREDPLEKEMATHSSILAWRIPWAEEPGRLQSTGSQRVRHDWATSLHFSSVHFTLQHLLDVPGGFSGKNPAWQCERCKRCEFRSLGGEKLLEENMATHSSIPAWRTSWTEEPVELCSIGWQRIGHNWNDLAGIHSIPNKVYIPTAIVNSILDYCSMEWHLPFILGSI